MLFFYHVVKALLSPASSFCFLNLFQIITTNRLLNAQIKKTDEQEKYKKVKPYREKKKKQRVNVFGIIKHIRFCHVTTDLFVRVY